MCMKLDLNLNYTKVENSMSLYHLLSTIVVFRISFLLILILPVISHATNVDSLKQELVTAQTGDETCSTAFTIYVHYARSNNKDSITFYSKKVIDVCDINSIDGSKHILGVITRQYYTGLSENISPLVDSLSNEIIDPNFKLLFFTKIADQNYINGDDIGFELHWPKAQEALTEAKDDNSRCVYYNFLGFQNKAKGNLFTAFQSFKLASTFDKADPKELLRNKYEIANIYVKTGELEKAKDLFEELIHTAHSSNNIGLAMASYYSLMHCVLLTEDFNELIRLTHKSIEYKNKNKVKTPIGYSYHILGESHMEIGNLDSARYYLSKGVEISAANNNSKELRDNYLSLSKYYKLIGENSDARKYLELAQSASSYYNNPEIDQLLADLWAYDGDYKKAYHHLGVYNENMLKEEQSKQQDIALATQIIEQSYSYKQEAEATLVESQKQERRLRNIIIATLAGLTLIFAILIFVHRNRKKLKALNHEISIRNAELDVSIRKQKETIQYLENFASVAAHDLKAPIRTASSFAGLLTRGGSDRFTEKEQVYLNFIGTGITQLSRMIDDLLSLSKLDADLPEIKQIDLNEIVDQVKTLLSDVLSQSDALISVGSSLPKVKGHATLLTQLFQNLIKNAIVHNKTGNNTVIQITSERKDANSYVIKIRDNSGGIPDHMIPNMFDLFSSSDKNTGNGIGLAICKKIINHYGGEIRAEVETGVGSTFHITLLR